MKSEGERVRKVRVNERSCADPEVREAEGAAARHLVHGAHEDGGRAVQLRHDAEVARQPVEALVRQHGVRVLHRHRVLDGQHRPATPPSVHNNICNVRVDVHH